MVWSWNACWGKGKLGKIEKKVKIDKKILLEKNGNNKNNHLLNMYLTNLCLIGLEKYKDKQNNFLDINFMNRAANNLKKHTSTTKKENHVSLVFAKNVEGMALSKKKETRYAKRWKLKVIVIDKLFYKSLILYQSKKFEVFSIIY